MLTSPKEIAPFQIARMVPAPPGCRLSAQRAAFGASAPLPRAHFPRWEARCTTMNDVLPMLATPGAELPTGPGWAYELKWDGVRALVDVSPDGMTIVSRRGNDVTPAYPELSG